MHAGEEGATLIFWSSSAIETLAGFTLQEASSAFSNRKMLQDVCVCKRSLAEGLEKEQMDLLLDSMVEQTISDVKEVVLSEAELDANLYIIRSGEATVRALQPKTVSSPSPKHPTCRNPPSHHLRAPVLYCWRLSQAMWTPPPRQEKDAPPVKQQRLVSLSRGMCFGEQALMALSKERMRRTKRKTAILVTKPPLVLLVLTPSIVNELTSLTWFDAWLEGLTEHIGATLVPGVDAIVAQKLTHRQRDGDGADYLQAAAAALMSPPKKAADDGDKDKQTANKGEKRVKTAASATKAKHGDSKSNRGKDDGKAPRSKDASSSPPTGARKSTNARKSVGQRKGANAGSTKPTRAG